MIKDWNLFFESIKNEPFAKSLKAFLDEEYENKVVYPPRDLLFNAFRLSNPLTLKAVIIGQDPYHNPGEAMGLSFSVPRGLDIPPSLRNIYKEIQNDLGIKMNMENGDLTPWAEQGVLLLNAYLSVIGGKPLSHKSPLYEEFDRRLLEYVDTLPQPIVFLLWGNFAKKFEKYIKNPNRLILKASHPSPLALSHGGFFNQHHFSRANDYLYEHNIKPISWQID